MDLKFNTQDNMPIDLKKYGLEEIKEDDTSSGGIDLSKYGLEPAEENPYIPPQPTGEKGLGGFATGFAKGALSTVKGLGQLGESVGRTLLPKSMESPSVYSEKALSENAERGGAMGKLFRGENLKAKGTAETLGKIAEFGAELFIPGRAAKKGVDSAKTLSRLADTPSTLSSVEEKIATLEGRVRKGVISGSKKILPSETEKRAAQILRGRVSSDVTKNPRIINKEIATRGAEVERGLAKAPKPVTADEQLKMWVERRKVMEKNLDKSQLKAFDEQFKMFLKQISDQGVVDTDTAKFYRAVKDYETNVASNLPRGKAILTDATGVASAKIQGAKAVRDIARKMIGAKHPEFKEKMFDLASLYDVLSTAITKSRNLTGGRIERFIKGHKILTGIGTAGATLGTAYLLGKKSSASSRDFSGLNNIGNQ